MEPTDLEKEVAQAREILNKLKEKYAMNHDAMELIEIAEVDVNDFPKSALSRAMTLEATLDFYM